jgi:Concanavalin A-like lectin/glucanases superfamily
MLAGYEAKLMHGTACVWGPEMRSRLSADDNLRSGDAVNLIEGLAELELSWPARGRATLRLEGPAGLVLMSDDGVSLNYGKLTANVELQYDNFAVETPLGRIVVADNARIGVASSPQAVELHVFDGQAEIITPWTSNTRSVDKLVVRADRSIRLAATPAGTVKVERGVAAEAHFTSQVSMAADLLEIPDKYVAAVKEAAPMFYWRFNSPVDGMVTNEMGDRYRGHVMGHPDFVDERGNMTIQFGAGLDTDVLRAYVVADRPLEGVAGHSYSIELWLKPSHYHLGTMAGLVSPPGNDQVAPGLHGVLLELGGQRSFYSIIEHPGRVRYLHRDPPSFDPALGTSCFSKTPYGLRKWQHLVAVKDGPEMRLYVDGEVVASAEDNTPLSDGLELLIGQLDRERDWRPFVGQLDELAFYNRSLSDPEIQQHYHLVRPVPVLRGGI